MEDLEVHLRDQIATLHDAGLNDEEAFLIAVRRMGNLDDLAQVSMHLTSPSPSP